MKKLSVFILILLTFTACKSRIKEQKDSLYSRHLQRHMELKVITTPMPDNKEEMNLLIFLDASVLESARAKKIIDSLYKHDLIQPLTLVAVEGELKDYGLEETDGAAAGQFKKFNDFISDELYTYAKKKVVIRKFNSVAVCGFGRSALSAFDIAWNHDEKIQKAGLFYPGTLIPKDSVIAQTIMASRKRPVIEVWMTENGTVPFFFIENKLKEAIQSKKSITDFTVKTVSSGNIKLSSRISNFGDFLVWAFPK